MKSLLPQKHPITPAWDPWDVWHTRSTKNKYELTSVEFTVTNLCNLRCEHCAVGDLLVEKEGGALPIDLLLQKLDEVKTLQTISITGGEPILSKRVVNDTIRPLLRYAKQRDIYTQINSNLTLPLSRYTEWIEDVDVLHISYNYRHAEDFYRMTFANSAHKPSLQVAEKLFHQMKDNARALTQAGVFVSAESFLSPFTAPHIVEMHQQIAEMGCQRHEIHPLYPSDFAKDMELLSLAKYKQTVETLLEQRHQELWMLFGTLPVFPCSTDPNDQQLWRRLMTEKNVTVRQDPDGRNRLNINAFTGDVIVTDFADLSALSNIQSDSLLDIFARWLEHPLAQKYHCYCPQAKCTGPNVLVAEAYYPDWEFQKRKAQISL